MLKLITALLAGAMLASTPAAAKVATWKEVQNWRVIGNPDIPYCLAYAVYSGQRIAIGVNPNGFNITVSGVEAYTGERFNVAMATNGTYGVLSGVAVIDGSVMFDRLAPETVLHLARGRTLEIHGLGRFSMKGSYVAIGEVMACYRAITGRDA